jgi:hypothetical protein
MTFGIIARRYASRARFLPPSRRRLFKWWTLERVLILAGAICVLGVVALLGCIGFWASTGFGPLESPVLLRILLLALTAIAAAIQFAFTAFLAGVMEIPLRR